jgi:hypothetical protein
MKSGVAGLALLTALAGGGAAAPPTFHQDIEPLLQRHCQQCHRTGEAAPMPLLDYRQVRPWAKAIREAVLSRRMPPWHAAATEGHFSNARALAAAEIILIRDWVDAGSPQGDPRHAPPPLVFHDGWNIGQPDHVFEMPVDFEVPSKGEIDYMHFAVPTGFKEDRWIERWEVRPGNRAAVHHIGMYLRPPGSKWLVAVQPAGPGVPLRDRTASRTPSDEHFAMFLPGAGWEILPPGQARLIPAGSDLIFQVHYQTIGKNVRDRSRFGVTFSKSLPRQRIHTVAVGNASFVIPPGDPNYFVRANFTLFHPVTILGITPHMHLRGKALECGVIPPGGEFQPLLRVPRYDRNWQMFYKLSKPVPVDRMTRLHCMAWFDNSANNPWNPDPTAEVRWGDQTRDEMMVGYFEVALPAEVSHTKALYLRGNSQ